MECEGIIVFNLLLGYLLLPSMYVFETENESKHQDNSVDTYDTSLLLPNDSRIMSLSFLFPMSKWISFDTSSKDKHPGYRRVKSVAMTNRISEGRGGGQGPDTRPRHFQLGFFPHHAR